MNKEYKLEKLENGFFYAVDVSALGKKGWNLNYMLGKIMKLPYDYPMHSAEWTTCKRVVATNNPVHNLYTIEIPFINIPIDSNAKRIILEVEYTDSQKYTGLEGILPVVNEKFEVHVMEQEVNKY
jgi:squalene cyclase